jgi:hypothetical protein
MTMRTRRVYVIVALALAVAETAAAQTSRFEVSGGYQTTRTADQTLPIGWSADIATNLNRTWSVVGEINGAYKIEQDEDLGVDVKLSLHSLGGGARWSSRVASRLVPFLQLLAGAARISAHTEILGSKVGDSSTKFMLQPGGGVNLTMNETFGVVGQVDYRRVFLDEDAREAGQNQLRAFVGIRIGL